MTPHTPERDPSSPQSIATATFSKRRKGVDPDEVRSFLVAVGAEFERLLDRVADLEAAITQMSVPVTDLSGLDDDAIAEVVSVESARVLQSARDEALRIRERAEESAARHLADSSIAAERVVREATESARRERSEVKARLREMIDEAERHVERVRLRADRNRESARLWAAEAERAQREVAAEFERARQVATDVIVALSPQSLVNDLEELEAVEIPSPTVEDLVDRAVTPDVVGDQVDQSEDSAESDGGEATIGQVVHLFGAPDVQAADDDEPSARDIGLVQIVPRLIRRAKRTFTDEQKAILAVLDGESVTDVADLIPGPDEHAASHVEVLLRDLEAAAVAGAESVGGVVEMSSTLLDEAVAVVAASVAGEVRRQLDGIVAAAAGDNAVIATGVRAMYRSLRREVVDERITDAALHAYSAGVLNAAPDGTTLQWVVPPDASECAECADNAVAGTVRAGSPFPTGHLAPPAHPGCRCDLEVDRG